MRGGAAAAGEGTAALSGKVDMPRKRAQTGPH